ncbi:MAG: glycoside hydrolase family 76 protein [Candidatus Dormibacteria bacterium]
MADHVTQSNPEEGHDVVPTQVQIPKSKLGYRLRRIAVAVTVIAASYLGFQAYRTFSTPYGTIPASCKVSPPPGTQSAITPAQASQAARKSFAALEKCFGTANGSFRGLYVGPATAWPESQGMAALLGLGRLPNMPPSLRNSIAQHMSNLADYWDSAHGGYYPGGRWFIFGGGVKKYDDNAWMGMDLLDAYSLTHNHAYLTQAERVATFEATGWSRNQRYPSPGGVFWQEPSSGTDRNAVSTGGAALLNAELYRITGKPLYKDRAEQYIAWTVNTLTLKNGLIGDHISVDGTVSPAIWSYNQGLVIATYASLFSTTGNKDYLDAANALAERTLSYLDTGSRMAAEPPIFESIFMRSLANLNTISPRPEYLKAMQRWATVMYNHMVKGTGVVHEGPVNTAATGWLLTQAAAVQAFSTYATAATAQHHSPTIYQGWAL